jgi:hypothetical protein
MKHDIKDVANHLSSLQKQFDGLLASEPIARDSKNNNNMKMMMMPSSTTNSNNNMKMMMMPSSATTT